MRTLLRRLLLVVLVIGMVGGLSILLIPQLRALIILFGETHVIHRGLNHDVWNSHLKLLAFVGLMICGVLLWVVVKVKSGEQLFRWVRQAFNDNAWITDGFVSSRYAPVPQKYNRSMIFAGVFAVILPAVVLLVFSGRDWLVDGPGWLDPYIYTGYGFNYPDHDFMSGYYKISRLPWVLVQVIAHRLLPHDLVTPILAGVMVLCLGILGYFLAWRFTRHFTVAVLTGNALALLPIFSNAGYIGGWSYHAVPGILLLGTGLCLLPLRGNEISWKRYIAVFSFMILALYTNPLTVIVLPGIALICFSPLVREDGFVFSKKDFKTVWCPFLDKLSLYALLSCIGVTTVLCVIHKILYKEWFFFIANLRAASAYFSWVIALGEDTLYRKISLFRADNFYYHISFLVLNAGLSLFLVISGRKKERLVLSRIIGIAYFFNFLLLFFCHHVIKTQVLNRDYLSLPITFLAVFPLSFFLARILPGWDKSWKTACFAGLMGGGLIVFLLLKGITVFLPYLIILLLIILVFGALFNTILFKRFRWANIVSLFIIYILFFCMAAQTNLPNYKKNDNSALHSTMINHNEVLFQFKQNKNVSLSEIMVSHLGDNGLNNFTCSFFELAGIQLPAGQREDIYQTSLELVLDRNESLLSEGYVVVFGQSTGDEDRAKGILQKAGWIPRLELKHEAGTEEAQIRMWIFRIEQKRPLAIDDALKDPELDFVFDINVESDNPQWDVNRMDGIGGKIYRLIRRRLFGKIQSPLQKTDGLLKYTTVTDRDHLAGPFRSVESGVDALALRIKYSVPVPNIMVQDENYKIISRIKLWEEKGGDTIAVVPLPGDVTRYRIYIHPGKVTSVYLPDEIEVWMGKMIDTENP
jgi:hypothetical protein